VGYSTRLKVSLEKPTLNDIDVVNDSVQRRHS